jgi:hypothetical protein
MAAVAKSHSRHFATRRAIPALINRLSGDYRFRRNREHKADTVRNGNRAQGATQPSRDNERTRCFSDWPKASSCQDGKHPK